MDNLQGVRKITVRERLVEIARKGQPGGLVDGDEAIQRERPGQPDGQAKHGQEGELLRQRGQAERKGTASHLAARTSTLNIMIGTLPFLSLGAQAVARPRKRINDPL
jgi:hypothetical protein